MCDVIKIRLKGGMREKVEKKTPKKEMDLDVFFMTSHMTHSKSSE